MFLRARLEVGAVRLEEMLGHRLDSRWAVDLQRDAPSEHPGSENEIRVADRVVGVQMRHEDDAQVGRLQRG